MQSSDTNQPSHSSGDGVGEMKEQAKEATRETMREARRQANETAERQKYAVADQAGSVAEALRKTGAELKQQDQSWLADAANRLADGADNLAGELRGQDMSSLLSRTQDFARRRPATFLGGAVAAGFLLTRFMKSSERSGQRRPADRPVARTAETRADGPIEGDGASRIAPQAGEVHHASPQ